MKINQLTEQEWALTMQIVKDAVENGFVVEVNCSEIEVSTRRDSGYISNRAEYGSQDEEEYTIVKLERLAEIAKTGVFIKIQG